METATTVNHGPIDQHYNDAANLLINQKMSAEDAKNALVARGLDPEAATSVVGDLEQQMQDARKESAKKDMLYGALWCVGGVIATIADIGFIFWGAILFGGVQFFKGLMNS